MPSRRSLIELVSASAADTDWPLTGGLQRPNFRVARDTDGAPSDTTQKASGMPTVPVSEIPVSRPQYCFRVGIRALLTNGDDTSRCVQSSAYWLAAIEGDYASGWSFNRCRAGVYLLAYFKVSAVTGFASGSRASCDAGFSQTRQTGSAVLL